MFNVYTSLNFTDYAFFADGLWPNYRHEQPTAAMNNLSTARCHVMTNRKHKNKNRTCANELNFHLRFLNICHGRVINRMSGYTRWLARPSTHTHPHTHIRAV